VVAAEEEEGGAFVEAGTVVIRERGLTGFEVNRGGVGLTGARVMAEAGGLGWRGSGARVTTGDSAVAAGHGPELDLQGGEEHWNGDVAPVTGHVLEGDVTPWWSSIAGRVSRATELGEACGRVEKLAAGQDGRNSAAGIQAQSS
jgi:hypothetical protein